MKIIIFIIVLIGIAVTNGYLELNDQSQVGPRLVTINDINNRLSSDEKEILEIAISRQVLFHQKHLVLPENIVVPTRLFDTQKNYQDFQKKVSKKSDSKNGFYSGSRKEIIIRHNKRAMKTIAHEAQHYIIRLDFRQRPHRWVNEGLSEFYEESYLKRQNVYVAVQNTRLTRLQENLSKRSLMPLSRYFKTSNKEWDSADKKTKKMYRTIGWGLIYFFMSTDDGKNILSDILRDLKRGSKKNSYQTVNALYPGGIDQLGKDFHSFIDSMPKKLKI